MTAVLDHFDAFNNGTWTQRFFRNSEFWDGTGPVFIYVGGEGALSGYEVLAGEIVERAQDHNALILSLEHRYYGKSQPTKDLSLPNMKWLSSYQALFDLASFKVWATTKFVVPSTSKWVTFGGSYPGALSAWARLKFPQHFHASLASSGPVHAIVDFQGYHDVVAASLSTQEVGGSDYCLSRTKDAFAAITNVLNSGDQSQLDSLQSQFCVCGAQATNPLDLANFVSSLVDNYDVSVQYDLEEGPKISVEMVCSYMNNTSYGSALDSAVALFKAMENIGACAGSCAMNVSYAASLEELESTEASPTGVGMRQWIFQTCTEFGYYQTCDANTACPFSTFMNLQQDLSICQDVFGLSPDSVKNSVMNTNTWFGSNTTVAPRVVYVDGTIDPWHSLAVIQTLAPESPAVLIDGTAHCQDLDPPSDNDPPALVSARKEIANYLSQWLQEDN